MVTAPGGEGCLLWPRSKDCREAMKEGRWAGLDMLRSEPLTGRTRGRAHRAWFVTCVRARIGQDAKPLVLPYVVPHYMSVDASERGKRPGPPGPTLRSAGAFLYCLANTLFGGVVGPVVPGPRLCVLRVLGWVVRHSTSRGAYAVQESRV
jgi:hypothetical protein